MHNKIIIYLHTKEITQPSWALVADDGTVNEVVVQGDAETLAQSAQGNEIIVIVPAEDVLLSFAKFPKMGRAKLLQALPYAFEDQLIEEVENLHFALGGELAGGEILCAVVAKEKIQSWITLLQSWHIEANVFLPLTLALPLAENQWNIVVSHIAAVRTEFSRGFVCDVENLNELLPLSLTSLSPELLPQRIRIDNFTEREVVLTGLPAQMDIEQAQKPAQQLYSVLAAQAAKLPAINLLQGEYRPKKSTFPPIQKVWTVAIYLGLTWMALLWLFPTISYFILKHRLDQIQNQITQIYYSHFPQSTSMIAPKLRMEEKLQQALAKGSEDNLLVLIGYLGKGKMEMPSITLSRFDFQQGQLSVDVASPSSDDLSKFVTFLSNQGLKVTQQNTVLAGASTQTTLMMR